MMPALPWALALSLVQPIASLEFTVELSPQVPKLDLDTVNVVAVSESGSATALPVFREGARVRFAVGAGMTWNVTCKSEGLWCPTLPVPAVVAGPRIELPVTGRALLTGEVRVAHPEWLPARLQVQGWGYLSESREPLSFEVSAAMDQARFEFSAPALRLDLRLASEGFSPSYLWDVEAQGKSSVDLGKVTLKRGSSLCGFVVEDSTGRPLDSAEVVLSVPRPPVGSRSLSVERLGRMSWTGRTNTRGFYQLAGLPVGNYRLEVKSPDPEHQLLVVGSVGILGDAETCLEDLAVRRAIEVSFAISPPRAPNAEPWLVRLHSTVPGGWVDPDSAVALDELGWASFRVAPGTYDLNVFSDSNAKSGRVKLLHKTIDLETSQHVPLSLALIGVEGSIKIGDDPLVARIDLWSQGGNTTLESDLEGLFSGWIRDPGDKSVIAEVSAAYPPFSRWLEIEDPTIDEGVLRLDLTFENRVLDGRVTDEQGTPIRRAEVTAVPVGSGLSIAVTTEVDGSFSLTGLAEKPYRVWARLRDFGVSERVRVDPWGEGTGPELTLVLRPGRRLRGRVTSAELDPVPGAKVSFNVPGGLAAIPSDSTGIDGRFEVRVPEWAARAVAQVYVASHVPWTACVELPFDEEGDLDLRLPALPGGRVILRVPEKEWLGPKGQLALVSSEGGFFNFTHLMNWVYQITGRGGVRQRSPEGELTFEIPLLATGHYAAIWNAGSVDLAALACSGAFSSAEWQYLAPGGEVTLVTSESSAGSG